MIAAFLETDESGLKPTSFEAALYASKVAEATGKEAIGFCIGKAQEADLKKAGSYGLKTIYHLSNDHVDKNHIGAVTNALAAFANEKGLSHYIMAKSSLSDGIHAQVAAKMGATPVGNVISLPDTSNGFTLTRSIFTGKAFSQTEVKSDKAVICIRKNTVTLEEQGTDATIESYSAEVEIPAALEMTEQTKDVKGVSLTDADIVVSGGRGFKGPENWGILEEFAKKLGAATGCSKPVSDMDWRPHHEHVGQTGVKVSPTLYFAVGISGAIQHVAGVNSSKVIVVINKDPDAAFFKVADYGIVGDLFEVLPKLTAALN